MGLSSRALAVHVRRVPSGRSATTDTSNERGTRALGGLPGAIEEAVSIGSLSLRHEPTFGPADGEVSGHLHPCAKLIRAGRGVRKRCFLTDGARLVMPAFGAYAGGLNVLDQAYAGLFAGAPSAAALGPRRVHLLALADLSGD